VIVEGIQAVFFYVGEMDRAVAFYNDVLGLPLLERSPTWSALDCGGVRVGLHLAHGDERVGDSGTVVSFRVADAHDAAARLRAAGVRVGDVSEEPFGLLVQLEDPDGNSLRLVQPSARHGTT
jgi:predicted enzyme related to lactoylglutathione lyase